MDHFRWNGLRPPLPGCILAALCLAAAACPPAWAALGSNAASIAADGVRFHAADTVTSHPLYSVHEMIIPSGTAVREYVAADGTVFAVGWEGPAMPDLRQMLGSHFGEFTAAARASQSGHHYLAAQRGDLVLLSVGRMRAFIGHAYLASALPPGVSLDELH